MLHVIPSIAASDGGPSRALFLMEQALTASGVTVVTATTDHGLPGRGPASEEVACGEGKISRFYARKLIDFYKIAPGLIPWLWRNVRSFDVVHIHALFSFSSLAAGSIAWARGVPYIIRPLGTLTRYGMTQRTFLKRASLALLEGPVLRRALAVHFTSQEELDEAKALKIGIRGVVIPLGVANGGPGSANCLEEEYPFLKSKTAILFLSRLDPKKNLEALLDAFASSPDLASSAILLVAGAGAPAYVSALKDRARALDISDRVVWLGHAAGERKLDIFARADIFVLPSFSENFGIAAVEAMLSGLPCILGEGVAVARRAAAEGAAIALTPGSLEIARALDRLTGDAGLRREMGARARAHAQRNYSTEVMAKSLHHLYGSLSAERAGK